MLRLKLPRLPREVSDALPPGLRWDAPPTTAALLLSRREFLKAIALLLAAAALPVTRARQAWAGARGRFLTGPERRTLEALCDTILPPDADPGGAALGAARYVDGLLSAFERRRVPFVYAGGPFSGRTPFPDTDRGVPSRRRPRNAFRRFVRLTRLQELRWRAELYGSDAVPGADLNDATLGRLRGLRDVYREGLARVDEVATAVAGASFAALPAEERARVFGMLDGAFAPDPRRDGLRFPDLLIQHTLEGCFAAPEYGGNRRTRGWRMIGLEGDSQPLGYSLFARATDAYRERPDHPMSTPNPDEVDAAGMLAPKPLGPDGDRIQRSIIFFSGLFGDGC